MITVEARISQTMYWPIWLVSQSTRDNLSNAQPRHPIINEHTERSCTAVRAC